MTKSCLKGCLLIAFLLLMASQAHLQAALIPVSPTKDKPNSSLRKTVAICASRISPSFKSGLALKRAGNDLYLTRSGGEKLLLSRGESFVRQDEGEIGTRITLPQGVHVTFGSHQDPKTGLPNGVLVVRRNGKLLRSFSLESLRDLWLKSPHVWPMQRGRRMIPWSKSYQVFVTDATRLGSDLVFIMNWRQTQSPAYPPVTHQFLLRLEVDPIPHLTRVMMLELKPRLEEDFLLGHPRRLYHYGDKVLLYVENRLIELHPGDLRQTPFLDLPPDLSPHGLIGERWMMFFHTDYSNALALWEMDLKTRQPPKRILELPENGTSFYYFPPQGNRFLLIPRDKPVIDLISVPEGTRAEIPDPRTAAWKALSGEAAAPIPEQSDLTFPGGEEVKFETRPDPKLDEYYNSQYPQTVITIRRNGQTIQEYPLAALRDEWLSTDRAWRNHSDANGMRYENGRRPFQLFISEPQRVGSDVLFILNWRDLVPSATPISQQFLMRLSLHPAPRLTAIRQFDLSAEGDAARFYRLYGKLLLYDRGTFNEMLSGGERLKPFFSLPAGLQPSALYEGRWLLLSSREGASPSIRVMDLKNRHAPLRLLSQPPEEWYGAASLSKSHSLLFNTPFLPMTQPVAVKVSLVDGKRTELPRVNGPGWLWLWQGWVIVRACDSIHCFDAATGGRIASLPL